MAKHTYTIAINRIPPGRDPVEYKFRGTKCTLICARDAAAVSFTMVSDRTAHEDLISFRVDHAKDAMRKMYLLHAISFSSRLRVRKVIAVVDGVAVEYEKETPGFPFLHSMLTAKDLALPEGWQDRSFQAAVLTATKSKADNDHRYACLFSFLAGTGKIYESERFTCYWTAVNALYNHLFDCANPFHAARGKVRYDDDAFNKQVLKGDAVGLSILLRLTGSGTRVSNKGDRDSFRQQYGATKTALRTVAKEELPELYRQLLAHRADRDWFPEGPLGEHLKACCARTGCSCWGFLLFDYAYYIRCHYLHGEKTPILFTAANDPELAAFRSLNVFLGEFLKEMLPVIFREDWFNQETYRSICPPRK